MKKNRLNGVEMENAPAGGQMQSEANQIDNPLRIADRANGAPAGGQVPLNIRPE